MDMKFYIYKSKGNGELHAGFILNKADGIYGIDITAALCMENKKWGWIKKYYSLRRLFNFVLCTSAFKYKLCALIKNTSYLIKN